MRRIRGELFHSSNNGMIPPWIYIGTSKVVLSRNGILILRRGSWNESWNPGKEYRSWYRADGGRKCATENKAEFTKWKRRKTNSRRYVPRVHPSRADNCSPGCHHSIAPRLDYLYVVVPQLLCTNDRTAASSRYIFRLNSKVSDER